MRSTFVGLFAVEPVVVGQGKMKLLQLPQEFIARGYLLYSDCVLTSGDHPQIVAFLQSEFIDNCLRQLHREAVVQSDHLHLRIA